MRSGIRGLCRRRKSIEDSNLSLQRQAGSLCRSPYAFFQSETYLTKSEESIRQSVADLQSDELVDQSDLDEFATTWVAIHRLFLTDLVDPLRVSLGLDLNSSFHGLTSSSSALTPEFPVPGNSGGGLYDATSGALVGLISQRLGAGSGELLFLKTDRYKLFIDYVVRTQGLSGFDPAATSAFFTLDCIRDHDHVCYVEQEDHSLQLQPSCGQLARAFAWRRLGLASPELWHDVGDPSIDDTWRLACAQDQPTVDEYEASIRANEPWYRLNNPQPFTLDDEGTVFPFGK